MQLWVLISLNGTYQDISGYRRVWLVNSVPVKNVVEQVSKHGQLHSSGLLGESVRTDAFQ